MSPAGKPRATPHRWGATDGYTTRCEACGIARRRAGRTWHFVNERTGIGWDSPRSDGGSCPAAMPRARPTRPQLGT